MEEKLRIRVNTQEEEDETFEFIDVDDAGNVVYNYKGKPFSGIIEHYGEGKLVGEEEFIDGHLGGLQRDYFENGKVKSEYYEYYSRLDGDFKIWDEKGNLTHHSVWKDGERLKDIL